MSASIKDKVAIIGMGCSKFGERWESDASDLMVEAAYEAYEDAGIDPKDIEAAWLGTVQSGMTGQPAAAALKLDYVPITRVENACCTATDAFRNACYAVAAGIHDIVLAIGVEKLKDTGWTGLGGFGAPGSSMVDVNTPPPVQFALAATRYAHHYNVPMDELKKTLARIAVKNHKNGALNPKAHFQKEISLEQALKAPMVAWPLGLFDCCGVSDGSAAAILTTPELARKFRDDYVLVKGIGMAVGGQQGMLQDDYDFVHFEENVRASQMAYREADVKVPLEEIDMAMVHDCFTITELVITEDLGFAPRGKGPEYHEAGTFDKDGELAINIDGGLKCFGHPIGASGIRMIYEVYKQLQGKAGARQRKNPRLGLTHNLGGRPGSFTCTVAIFGKED
ncbi:MAG: acetyl-CoA acetyltransferase [Candidatus Abyssobacteria bacterium SURF_5]|uniref:Acetyl-CoA acetyltransferase n=1 Tax=Abyssobacteria bacterium (strain SURF_5) TaxID=2093360 RepID=A0A3A4NY32_ABYX5|nr:MAG: acetyl-CoA acetyltransferase [Candidatus Abyssubacteria bacterium SURF_5]